MRTQPVHTILLAKVQEEGKRILRYWHDHVMLSDGSFHGEIAHDGTVHADADRGGVLAARLLWTFARTIVSGFDESLDSRQTADNSYVFFRERFWDSQNLGFYWLINKIHQPIGIANMCMRRLSRFMRWRNIMLPVEKRLITSRYFLLPIGRHEAM